MDVCDNIHLILEMALLSITVAILATAILTLATTMILLRYARQVAKGLDTTYMALELMARKVEQLWFTQDWTG